MQIFDGRIIADSDERGKALQMKVISHMQNRPQKSKAEIERLTDYLKYVENNFYSKWKYLSNDTITTGSLQVPSDQYLLAICITAHVSYIISCHSIETQYI